jgi:hypothetical protein
MPHEPPTSASKRHRALARTPGLCLEYAVLPSLALPSPSDNVPRFIHGDEHLPREISAHSNFRPTVHHNQPKPYSTPIVGGPGQSGFLQAAVSEPPLMRSCHPGILESAWSHCHTRAAFSAAQGMGVCRHLLRPDRRGRIRRCSRRLRRLRLSRYRPLSLLLVLLWHRGPFDRKAVP